jgi:hypothetical protein
MTGRTPSGVHEGETRDRQELRLEGDLRCRERRNLYRLRRPAVEYGRC